MPQRKSTQENFYYTRTDDELEFEKLFEKTTKRNQCKNCVNCKCAELVDFEVERKQFYTFNKDVLDW